MFSDVQASGYVPVMESRPATMDDLFMTPNEVADFLKCDTNTLANQRARGEGLPYTKVANGRVLYTIADVLTLLKRGARGFTWARMALALDSFPGLTSKQRLELLAHLKDEMGKP